jgi:uncharacterized DUF497 family protein
MKVTWDPNKEQNNIKRHHISFAYAAEAFHDPLRIIKHDDAHNNEEDRYVNIGKADDEVVLFVVETEVNDETTRIITARKASAKEREEYANGRI